jgi:hypothetical protein
MSPKRISHGHARGCSKNAVKLKFEKDKGEDETRRIKRSHAVWDERKVNSKQEMLSSRRNKKKTGKKAPPDIVSYMILFPPATNSLH